MTSDIFLRCDWLIMPSLMLAT